MITNTIIVITVVLLAGLAVYIQIRKAKKTSSSCGCDSGCCSSMNTPEKTSFHNAKKLILNVEGMHCGHCQNSVSEALNSLDGVSATVDLENNCANVELSKDVPEADLIEAVSAKGFEVTAVKTV